MMQCRYGAILSGFILMCAFLHTAGAEIILKPSLGYGAPSPGSVATSFIYGGQVGFYTDIALGNEGLVSFSGSTDSAWWQNQRTWRASGQGSTEFSLARGLWIYQAGIDGAFADDRVTKTAPQGNVQFHITGIRNSFDFSLQFDGAALVAFGQNYDREYSGAVTAFLLWGETVVKPSLGFSGAFAQNIPSSWSISPKLRLAWYPAFPVALDLSFLYQRDLSITENLLQILAELSVQPLPLLGFSISHGAYWTDTAYTGSANGELRVNLGSSRIYNSWYFVSGALGYGISADPLRDWEIKTGVSFTF
jgi:hypothetical protein